MVAYEKAQHMEGPKWLLNIDENGHDHDFVVNDHPC